MKFISNSEMVRHIIIELMADHKTRTVNEIVEHVLETTGGKGVGESKLSRSIIDGALHELMHSGTGYVKDGRGVYRYEGAGLNQSVRIKQRVGQRVSNVFLRAMKGLNEVFTVNMAYSDMSPISMDLLREYSKIGKEVVGRLQQAKEYADELFTIYERYEKYAREVEQITNDPGIDGIYTSPDFQCDQTGGFPTSLCVCWEKGRAWLQLNDLMIEKGQDVSAYQQMCADYGVRNCYDISDYNNLLRGLGEDAVQIAELPPEQEESEENDVQMGGI